LFLPVTSAKNLNLCQAYGYCVMANGRLYCNIGRMDTSTQKPEEPKLTIKGRGLQMVLITAGHIDTDTAVTIG
jgi:hypothetical protein